MKPGLTMLELKVETENGDVYYVGIDREKTIIRVPWDYNHRYTLIACGPILIGWEMRGIYKKGREERIFESTKVTNIIANFRLNHLFA